MACDKIFREEERCWLLTARKPSTEHINLDGTENLLHMCNTWIKQVIAMQADLTCHDSPCTYGFQVSGATAKLRVTYARAIVRQLRL